VKAHASQSGLGEAEQPDLAERRARRDPATRLRECTIGGLLREATASAPDRVALIEGTTTAPPVRRRWTYRELLAEAERLARALGARFAPGERLAILSPNRPEWEIVQFGAALAGLTLVPLNTSNAPAELAYILQQSQAAGIVLGGHRDAGARFDRIRNTLPDLREVLDLESGSPLRQDGPGDALLPQVDPDQAALILYTSGTTGAPKGVVLSHRGVVGNAELAAGRLGLGPGAVWLNPLPMYHSNGSVFFALGAMAQPSTHIIGKFDPRLMLELIESEQVTFVTGVPTFLTALLDAAAEQGGRRLSSLRLVTTGGTTVPPELIRRLERQLGVDLVVIYGQTEAGGLVTATFPGDPIEEKVDKVGRALDRIEVRVVDIVTGASLPPGEVGEIQVRSGSQMREYFRMPEQTARALDAEGWLRTGDLGTLDGQDRLQVTGRLKDVIIRGGENIYPREVEDVLITHPDIAEIAVVGVPDDYYGEEVGAVVRLEPGRSADTTAWAAAATERLSHRKVPRRWFVVDAMPLTASGKIQKFRLRGSIENAELSELPPLPAAPKR
jgi:fatty-acyl-CoA synthase